MVHDLDQLTKESIRATEIFVRERKMSGSERADVFPQIFAFLFHQHDLTTASEALCAQLSSLSSRHTQQGLPEEHMFSQKDVFNEFRNYAATKQFEHLVNSLHWGNHSRNYDDVRTGLARAVELIQENHAFTKLPPCWNNPDNVYIFKHLAEYIVKCIAQNERGYQDILQKEFDATTLYIDCIARTQEQFIQGELKKKMTY